MKGIEHAFGHTWESCYAMHLTTGQPTFLYLFQQGDAKVVCPIAEREFNGYKDIVTPYGFSGFAGNREVPEFQKYWKQFVKERGYVCGYIGLNPILKQANYVDRNEVAEYNTLYVIDLQLSFDQLYARLSSNRKRQLKSFEEVASAFTIDKSILKDFFLSNYHDFFSRKNAAAVYNFSIASLSFLAELENVFVVGYMKNNHVEAISVFAYTPYMAEYLFNISLPGAEQYAAPFIWFAIRYLKQKKVPLLNLGGGVKAGDSIAGFKERFGPDQYALQAAKQIYDIETFKHLCIQTGQDFRDRDGYFPPYRKPRES